VFLHFPVPHPPGIWDASQDRITTGHSNYIDNLELADKVLGQVKRELQATGDWDSSTILVTGDHPYRTLEWLPYTDFRDPEMLKVTGGKGYPYVPFLLKMPGQHQGLKYDRAFNNVLTSDLLLDVLNGRVSKPDAAVRWLDAHAEDSRVE
jgi:arylsulfatase A-like enzyme